MCERSQFSNVVFLVMAVFYVLLISACAGFQLGKGGLGPSADFPFRSVDYYNNHYNVDLLEMNHYMDREIQLVIRANANANKFVSHIAILGESVRNQPEYLHLQRSIKLGPNQYYIGLENYPPIEKQIDNHSCWAACIQYLIYHTYNKKIDQESIIKEIKEREVEIEPGASVVEMMKALGYIATRLTPAGSRHIIEILGRGYPLIIGSHSDPSGKGHAEVVVGAKYSFVNPYIPSLAPQEAIAFSEITVLDPWDGEIHVRTAREYDGKIDFVLSFNVKE